MSDERRNRQWQQMYWLETYIKEIIEVRICDQEWANRIRSITIIIWDVSINHSGTISLSGKRDGVISRKRSA